MPINDFNLAELDKLAPDRPAVMLNLMRFRARSADGDGTGWEAYLRYSKLTSPLIKAEGGRILWTGDAKAVPVGDVDANQWHFVALVWWPSPAAFRAMVTSPVYAVGNTIRREGEGAFSIL